ncbi:acyltransferase [Gammaproteobacteria bacterium]|nr:acyltransferase [Gammaproteobacteria bacterium]
MNYRPEIDGLRALAVLPVIFFHAGYELFSGGFVGVDIFFVISGYLITSIIIGQMANDSFSIVKFYERRARRILPALFFVSFISIPFAWLWLSPNDLQNFGKSLIAVSTFSSNILFWMESSYFATDAELIPLLHTWSLAVEEQFYILFPLFLIVAWKLKIRLMIFILLCLFIISLSIAHWGSFNKPSATFYLLPTRGWELLVGVFAAFYLKNKKQSESNALNQFLSILGLIMIFFSIIIFSKTTPFPSLYALIPTIGTALLILFVTQNTLAYKLLTLAPILNIGLISYSTYLWHQPLLAFARHSQAEELANITTISLCILSLIMGYISWKWIEQPFRNKSQISQKKVFIFSLTGMLALSLVGSIINIKDGFLERYSENDMAIYAFRNYDTAKLWNAGSCFLGTEENSKIFQDKCFASQTLIWGDSFGAALSPGLRELNTYKNIGISQLTTSACPSILYQDFPNNRNCKKNNEYVLSIIEDYPIKQVFLHNQWSAYNDESISKLVATIEQILLSNSIIEIFVVGGVPEWDPSLPRSLIKKNILLSDFDRDIYLFNPRVDKIDKKDQLIAKLIDDNFGKNVKFISVLEELCTNQKCLAVKGDGLLEPFTFDYGHLTLSGSMEVASIIHKNVKH